MKKQKLKLSNLQVKSFVTELADNQPNTVKGGQTGQENRRLVSQGCPNGSQPEHSCGWWCCPTRPVPCNTGIQPLF